MSGQHDYNLLGVCRKCSRHDSSSDASPCPGDTKLAQQIEALTGAKVVHAAPQIGKTIYLSGPMTGHPKFNYPLFNVVAAQLRAAGHTVYNPSEFPHDGEHDTFPLRKAFAEYTKFICEEADTIVLLPGWEASLGVSAELALAKNCRLEVVEFKDLKISFD